MIGLVVAVVGGAAAFWLIGPDDTVQSGEQSLSSKGLAIASTPDLLNRHGPVLHVDVRSTKNQPVFVGVARDFDVSSYLKGTAYTKLVQVQFPVALTTQESKGTAGPLAAPDTLDWWVAKANGAGTQSIAWPIEDGPYDVVIMNADGKTAPDAKVDLGIEIPKAFVTALGIFAAGIILLAVGILLVLFRRRPAKSHPTNGTTAHSEPWQSQAPQSPSPQQQFPPAQYPPAQYPPAQGAPPAPVGPQQQPQGPPAQYPPVQGPPAQRPPMNGQPPRPAPAQGGPGQQPPVQGQPQQPPVQGMPPQRPQGGGAVRRVLTVGLAFGLVSGCSAVPQADTVTTLTRPAISDAAAAAVIKHYNDVNNKANSTRNSKLIATIEGGNLVRESQAGYTIDQYAKAKPIGAFTYTKPVIGAPQVGSYPMRFVSSSGISDNAKYRHVGLWERETAGSPWMLMFAAGVPTTVKLPDLTGIRPATKADDTRLAVAPQLAATSLATYLTGGAASPRAAAFQPNSEIKSLLAGIVSNRAEKAKQPGSTRGITDAFTAPQQSPAYVTKSGTAVVFVSLTHEYTLLPGVHWQFWWAGMPENAFSPAAVKYQSGLTSTTIHDAVLLIPPKGKGKIQVASFESQVIDAGGY
ncbi:hypothetical protein OHA18_36215 [Kribbella sp. NBC_00709]|uniref:hypothetical protein n=1 Tax=Kribbella sp. NBC_00709 TaxID=2975972 RepID=UPI002E2C2292|nr:hypothetical protein [Kribbella sp. NBC_00709]